MKLREIAREAGVSLTTVSLVLNGKPGVGAEKRRQIRQLLLENGYRLQSAGEDPVATKNIYFLKYNRQAFQEYINPGFASQIMDAAQKECRKLGYRFLVSVFDDFDSVDLPALLSANDTRGALLLGTYMELEDVRYLTGLRKPVVVVDNALEGAAVTSITMHNHNAIRSAVAHLAELGHKKIGFLASAVPCSNDRARRWAFREALHDNGLLFFEKYVFPLGPTMDGAREATLALLDAGADLPTALVANNDSIAIGAMQALRERGFRIPQDISLTGFDGLPFSEISDPPLSTVNVPLTDMGRWSVRILHDMIRGRSTTWSNTWMGTEFLVRGSTGPCPEAGGKGSR